MKRKLISLAREYQAALRRHLKQGRKSSLASAHKLGCRAAAIGLETLAVARIHEQAVATLTTSGRKAAMIGRAKFFLEESRRLQKQLRHLTHQLLSEQEDARGKISRDLHDEIAQTLLGISVRLLTLKKEAANTEGLQKAISGTQRLVKESVKTVNRFARKFGIPA